MNHRDENHFIGGYIWALSMLLEGTKKNEKIWRDQARDIARLIKAKRPDSEIEELTISFRKVLKDQVRD